MSEQIKPSVKNPVIKRKDCFSKRIEKKVKTKCMEKIRKKFSLLGIS